MTDKEKDGLKTYVYYSQLVSDMSDKLESSDEDVMPLLQEFYKNLNEVFIKSNCFADLKPLVSELYTKILVKLPVNDAKKSLEYMTENHRDIIEPTTITALLKKYPDLADWFFNKIYMKIELGVQNGDVNSIYTYMPYFIYCFQYADANKKQIFIKEILNYSPFILDVFNSRYASKFYNLIPDIRKSVLDFIVSYSKTDTTSGMEELFKNLSEIVITDKSVMSLCLDFVDKYKNDNNTSNVAMKNMIKILAIAYEIPEYKERTEKIINEIRASKKIIGLDNIRAIARIIGDTENLRSTMIIGQRVEKTEDNPFGFKIAKEIPEDEICVLFFGGNGTDSPKKANGYMSGIKELLESSGISTPVNIYSVLYNFGEREDKGYMFDDSRARKLLGFQMGRRRVKIDFEPGVDDVNPRYVQMIFEKIFLPRISKDGKKIDVESAKRNIRNINIVAHCHGGYTFIKLEEIMQEKMAELGYSKQDALDIQKQLLCIAYAPYCPLGVSKSTFVGFCSARDTDSKYFNLFGNIGRSIIQQESDEDIFWFPEKKGNFFAVSRLAEENDHDFTLGIKYPELLTKGGKKLTQFEQNAIVNGIKSSLSGTPLPSVKELVCGDDKSLGEIFDNAENMGDSVYQKILLNIKTKGHPHA